MDRELGGNGRRNWDFCFAHLRRRGPNTPNEFRLKVGGQSSLEGRQRHPFQRLILRAVLRDVTQGRDQLRSSRLLLYDRQRSWLTVLWTASAAMDVERDAEDRQDLERLRLGKEARYQQSLGVTGVVGPGRSVNCLMSSGVMSPAYHH